MKTPLPPWATELVSLYESDAANQFILYGNVQDRLLYAPGGGDQIKNGGLPDFLLEMLLPGFDVVLTYDLGNGIRVVKGREKFFQWPHLGAESTLPRGPRAAVDTLTHYFRYTANLAQLGRTPIRVACIIKDAHLVAPHTGSAYSHDLNAIALLLREWSTDTLLTGHQLATFLISENLNELHPLLATNSRAASLELTLPSADDLAAAFRHWAQPYAEALKNYEGKEHEPAAQLTGTTLNAVESLLKQRSHQKAPITRQDLVDLKKDLVEKDCNGLIEFIETKRNFDDLYGMEAIKHWMRQDIALWQKDDLEALPMGYLLCGPVGTGKTYLAKCLAGEAGVPVVKLKNFRDKWVGSTEGNLERIFRLLHALGRCIVFIDEADQSLGKRTGGSNDSGVSGRVYSMIAQEMSNPDNRGHIIWVLASSRPDLIEVDLKRPGRIDVKIPIFPTTTPEESFALIRVLCKRRKVDPGKEAFEQLGKYIPTLVTPGAAEAIAVKVYRRVRTRECSPSEALEDILKDYQSPVPQDVMDFQIGLAAQEASDLEFVPERFRQSL